MRILDYAPKSVLTGSDKGYNALFIEAPTQTNKSAHYFQSLAGGVAPLDQAQPTLFLPKPPEAAGPPAPAPMTLEAVVALLPPPAPPPWWTPP